MDFLYTNGYDCQKTLPPNAIDSGDHDPGLIIHAKLYVIADKFDIQDLQELAQEKFKNELSRLKNNNADIFAGFVYAVECR